MKLFFFINLMLMCLFLSAGNLPLEKAKIDFSKVNNTYSATPTFSSDIQYSVYDNHVGGNLIEQKKGQFFKSKSSTYTKILDIETIVNSKTTIVVNNEEKILVIVDTKKIELSPIQTNMDTLLKMCSSIKFVDVGKTERHYTLDFSNSQNSEFSKIEVFINLTNYSIKQIIMYYNDSMPMGQTDYYAEEKKPRLEITYKTFSTKVNFDQSLFIESTYLGLVGSKYTGKGKYLSYKVINQLQSFRFKNK